MWIWIGTIIEYVVYSESDVIKKLTEKYDDGKPLNCIIDKLKQASTIPNLDIYILTLSKSNNITTQKKQWLKQYTEFIPETNWIIIDKENGEYSKENRDVIKAQKIQEKLQEYNHAIFLDDDHKVLKVAQDELKDRITVFHISSALI